jgi:DNA-binding NarL/FixJ family response regulator
MFSLVIIDDSPVIQERLADRLKPMKGIHKLFRADNKTDALTIIQANKLDLIILDLQLPDGTGIEILRSIRTKKSDIICIVLTNFPYSVLRKQCEDLGANYFFDKSTEFHEVINVIESLTQERIPTSSTDQEVSKQYT